MNITQPLPNVLYIQFDTTTEMSSTFGRVQEYAEGPKLHHQVMSWSRLKNYHKSKGESRTFNAAWLGFNIPGWAFKEFYEKCNHFKPKEKAGIELVLSYNFTGKFYVICDADKNAKRESQKAGDHELAHALFGTNDEYKNKVLSLLNNYSRKSFLLEKIKKMGCYAPEVWDDELHAYVTTDTLSNLIERFNLPKNDTELVELKQNLETLFAFYRETKANV